MVYYTNGQKKVEVADREIIGSGTQGTVYRLGNDECCKVYGQNVLKCDPNVFELLRDAKLGGYCELHDLLHPSLTDETISGYTMKFYHDNGKNIMNLPVEYTVDSFSKLYDSFSFLADNHVLAKDTIPVNSIMTDDGIVLIDFDASCYSDLDKRTCLDVNSNNLLYLFRKTFERDIERLGIPVDDEISYYLDDLFENNGDKPKTFCKKIESMSTPMEALPFKYRYR